MSGVDIRPKSNGVGTICKVTVEDFKGSVTFTLFDKDYEAFSGFLRVHEFLLLRVYVAPRFNKIEDKNARGGKRFEISGGFPKIRAMSLLANVRESMIKEIVIDVPLDRRAAGDRQQRVYQIPEEISASQQGQVHADAQCA